MPNSKLAWGWPRNAHMLRATFRASSRTALCSGPVGSRCAPQGARITSKFAGKVPGWLQSTRNGASDAHDAHPPRLPKTKTHTMLWGGTHSPLEGKHTSAAHAPLRIMSLPVRYTALSEKMPGTWHGACAHFAAIPKLISSLVSVPATPQGRASRASAGPPYWQPSFQRLRPQLPHSQKRPIALPHLRAAPGAGSAGSPLREV